MAKPDKKQEVVEEVETEEVLTEAQLKNQKRQEKLQQRKQAKAKANAKRERQNRAEKQQGNKPGKGREIVGELKKVTWPTFGQVVKNTLLVIGIVLLITIGLFVVDRLFSWIYQLLVSGTVQNWWF